MIQVVGEYYGLIQDVRSGERQTTIVKIKDLSRQNKYVLVLNRFGAFLSFELLVIVWVYFI